MNTQHTPGPWHVERHQKIVWQDSGGPGNCTYATQYPILLIVHEQLGDPRLRTCVAQLDNSTESDANSDVIAAAPDLLEACEAALMAADDTLPLSDDPKRVDVLYYKAKLMAIFNAAELCRIAIAKAKGQS